jgi:hypothetical protein
MAYLDDIQNTIHLDSATSISDSFQNLKMEIIERGGFETGLRNAISQLDRDAKFRELEQLCEKSGNHDFLHDLKHKVFTEQGFRYFALVFYAHIYHAFEDVIFGIAHHAPPSVSLRRILIHNLWEEFGSGEQKNSHLQIYEDTVLSFLQAQPLQESEMQWIALGHESERCLFATKYGVDPIATSTANMWTGVGKLPYKAALGATTFGSEYTPRHLFPPIVDCMKRSGLPDDVARFFNLHIACDECHFSDLMQEFPKLINTRQDLVETEAGTRIMLQIRSRLFDHLQDRNLFA